MPGKLVSARPVLASLNILKTVEYYEQKLGFERRWCDEDYGVVIRDQILIHFWRCSSKLFPENTSCYVEVENIEELYKEFQNQNVIHPRGKLKEQDWGMIEFSILDLDGNLIRFGQEL